ncbi:muramoyltetrapeptide carboxypeptidase [Massilia pseudoviolaceinigra]|uniref:muramoyltetrapeptide carboxypeptidase n=1 Tax=Massilia pseudoviolaceinigra TaxID=3057165 RepID=UPI0027964727|nr:muramoyltetrapeptide carboxypeptidase [Massilia sp. CCM 9206]MDQ1923391.1 muramoyltetrapeptide carboxypeptidase [Massilia sp. CCM 9206]
MNSQPIGIAIVAPSGYGSDNAAIERGIAALVAQGHTVHNYFEADKVFQRFGGTDAARLAQLNAAASDPQVQVVMALRGQYGLTRLLPEIDFARMADSGKIFVGYSDFTAFHMGLMAKTGAQSYAGPMFYSDFGAAEPVAFTQDDFWRCLRGPRHVIRACVTGNPEAEVEGTIWGGNLAMLISLLGTDWFARIDDGILFVEDINEHPYRVERMLLQLLQAGVLGRQKALVLGDFSGFRLSPADNGYDFCAMLAYLRATLPIPVLTGLPFGHTAHRATIPFGAHAQLCSDEAGFTLTMSGYPTVAHG